MSAPSSYIKTEGTAVTRSADVVKIDGTAFSNMWNPNGSTVLMHHRWVGETISDHSTIFVLSDGTVSNRFTIRRPSFQALQTVNIAVRHRECACAVSLLFPEKT